MAEGWVTLVCPRGAERELASHGEYGYVPYPARDSAGRLHYLVPVPTEYARYWCNGAGYSAAPDELQGLEPPVAPIRSYAYPG
jgi:hypothetical protein